MPYYALLDRTPKGRDERPGTPLWVRRHDEYRTDTDPGIDQHRLRFAQPYRPGPSHSSPSASATASFNVSSLPAFHSTPNASPSRWRAASAALSAKGSA